MGQFDGDSGGEHLVGAEITEVGGEQGEHRTYPFTPGLHQMPGRGVGQPVGVAYCAPQPLLHLAESGRQRTGEPPTICEELVECPWTGWRLRHGAARMAPAQSRNGAGNTPSITVAAIPAVTATAVSGPTTTTVPSRESSSELKYIRTITRR